MTLEVQPKRFGAKQLRLLPVQVPGASVTAPVTECYVPMSGDGAPGEVHFHTLDAWSALVVRMISGLRTNCAKCFHLNVNLFS